MVSPGAVSALVGIVGLMLTAVALFASWKVTRNTQATSLYRDTALAWEAKSKVQEAEIEDLKEKIAGRAAELAELRGKVGVLQEALTGAKSWQVLEGRTAEMLALAADLRSEYRATHETLGKLRTQMTTLSSKIDHLTGGKP